MLFVTKQETNNIEENLEEYKYKAGFENQHGTFVKLHNDPRCISERKMMAELKKAQEEEAKRKIYPEPIKKSDGILYFILKDQDLRYSYDQITKELTYQPTTKGDIGQIYWMQMGTLVGLELPVNDAPRWYSRIECDFVKGEIRYWKNHYRLYCGTNNSPQKPDAILLDCLIKNEQPIETKDIANNI